MNPCQPTSLDSNGCDTMAGVAANRNDSMVSNARLIKDSLDDDQENSDGDDEPAVPRLKSRLHGKRLKNGLAIAFAVVIFLFVLIAVIVTVFFKMTTSPSGTNADRKPEGDSSLITVDLAGKDGCQMVLVGNVEKDVYAFKVLLFPNPINVCNLNFVNLLSSVYRFK